MTESDPAAQPVLPPSATHPTVALCGLSAFVSCTMILSVFRPFETMAYNALILIAATAAGIFLPDLFWQKVWQRPSTGLTKKASPGNWPRALIKFAGQLGAMALIGALYWLFPEYNAQNAFYQPYWALLVVIVPPWIVLSLPYFYILDQFSIRPEDSLWHLGKLVTGQWRSLNSAAAWQQLLGWLIKGFFYPLMFVYFCNDLSRILNFRWGSIQGFHDFYDFFYSFFYYVDVGLISMTYLISLRLTDTHIRSAEPTMLGWAVALVCYEPFWSLIGRQYLQYGGEGAWQTWMVKAPWLYQVWGSIILLLVFVYAWATMSFGGRFSNLTHRGIITSGPYRFMKHPAYFSKNLSWWLTALPFAFGGSLLMRIKHCAALLMLNGIYFMRAKTEERHLSLDPTYVRYAAWLDARGLLRGLQKSSIVRRWAKWKMTF